MVLATRIASTGAYLPPNVYSNDMLKEARGVDTSHDWIVSRTGIEQRHLIDEGTLASDLATNAAKDAFRHTSIKPEDIDLLILATTTPDRTFPATAMQIQANLGLVNAAGFDIQAACSGFIYGLRLADSLIRSGMHKRILFIGAEVFSSLIDWEDRSTCVLFGDGAGAVILEAVDVDDTSISSKASRIIDTSIFSDGAQQSILQADGGPSLNRQVGRIQMQGREVFKLAVTRLGEVADDILQKNGYSHDDLDWLVPHQANLRIIDATSKRLNMPDEKVIITVNQHANTSAASIPMAFNAGVKDGRIKRGDLVMFEAFGAGLTWGACLLRF